MNPPINTYSLLDSGNFQKLERFGDKILIRPSSLCAWMPKKPDSFWQKANAEFIPDRGWHFEKQNFSTWTAVLSGTTLELELQTNGQIGVFPEHAQYLSQLGELAGVLQARSNEPLKILNLFAYTGLATCFLASFEKNHVTHVDLSKQALTWASKNIELNGIPRDRLRLIPEDALTFLEREIRRGNHYDIIVIDPPSFSRVNKQNSWTLEEKLPEICDLCFKTLNQEAGGLFFTNHSSVNTVDVIRNIALDRITEQNLKVETQQLALSEADSPRRLPAGALISLAYGIEIATP